MNSTQSYILPVELIRWIFEDVDAKADLATLAQCSKLFQAESQRLLYRSMTHHSGTIHFKFLTTIVKKPHLASVVQVYHRYSEPHTQRRSLTSLFMRALPLMTNLKELLFGHDSFPLDVKGPPAFVAQKCSFQLETLVSANVDFDSDDFMMKVLGSNMSLKLKSLYWGTYRYDEVKALFGTNAMPQLTSFSGPLKLMKFVLPGRNITSLNIVEHEEDDTYEDISQFKTVEAELRRVKSFCLIEYWHPFDSPRNLLQLMPALQTIQIADFFLNIYVSHVIELLLV